MILNFSTVFPWGEPTHFAWKIRMGRTADDLSGIPRAFWQNPANHPKYHTIREDKAGRWHDGMPIDFFTGIRTKAAQRIMAERPPAGIQRIHIFPTSRTVVVDNRWLSDDEIKRLARNDGFDTVDDFFRWFNKPFEGKLIHWSSIRY